MKGLNFCPSCTIYALLHPKDNTAEKPMFRILRRFMKTDAPTNLLNERTAIIRKLSNEQHKRHPFTTGAANQVVCGHKVDLFRFTPKHTTFVL